MDTNTTAENPIEQKEEKQSTQNVEDVTSKTEEIPKEDTLTEENENRPSKRKSDSTEALMTNKKIKEPKKKAKEENIVEKGDIYFFIRPKESGANQSLEQIDELLFVQNPEGSKNKRLICMKETSFPPLTSKKKPQHSGIVQIVSDNLESIDLKLGEIKHDITPSENIANGTESIKEVKKLVATPIAEGSYVINSENGHTFLGFVIEKESELMKLVGINKEGRFHITASNPKSIADSKEVSVANLSSSSLDLPEEKSRVQVETNLLDLEGLEIGLVAASATHLKRMKSSSLLSTIQELNTKRKEKGESNRNLQHFLHVAQQV